MIGDHRTAADPDSSPGRRRHRFAVLDDRETALEEKNDQENDEDQKENPATDVHVNLLEFE